MSERVIGIVLNAFPQLLLKFVQVTVPLTILSFALALVIAVVAAIVQYAKVPVLTQIIKIYIWITRGTPLLVQLFVVFFGLPSIGIKVPAFPAAVVVMAFNEGAYMAESMRGALESVPKGQLEAGHCVGMNYIQIMWRIVLPQAFRIAFPSLSNSLISMLKETSLAASITVTEMFRQAQVINGRVFEALALYMEVALIYLFFCSILTVLQHFAEKKLNAYGGVK